MSDIKNDEQDHPGSIDFDPSSITSDASGHIIFPEITCGGFAYQNSPLEEEVAEQARHRGFIRVHKLVDAMAECVGWDEALPHIYRLLCCDKLPGSPLITGGRDRRSVWYTIMRTLMSDLQFDWVDVDPSVVPPQGLQPYEHIGGQFTPANRKTGHEFAQQFVKLDDFNAYVQCIEKTLRLSSLPLPVTLFSIENSETPLETSIKPESVDRQPTESQSIYSKNVFKNINGYWNIIYDGRQLSKLNYSGLKYIHYLIDMYLNNSNDSISVIDLETAVEGIQINATWSAHDLESNSEDSYYTSSSLPNIDENTENNELNIILPQAAETLADVQALKSYRKRFHELDKEIKLAEKKGDLNTAKTLVEEKESFIQSLAKNYGMVMSKSGNWTRVKKDMKSSDSVQLLEAARKRVNTKINECIRRLRKHDIGLAQHLSRALKPVGVYPRYKPQDPIHWDL